MGIITEMNSLLQTKIPQWITKLQQLGPLCGVIPRGHEKVKWAATKTVSKNLRMHDLGRSLLGEFSTSQRGCGAQESVLRVDRAKGAPEGVASEDPRVRQLGRTLSDEFAVIREKYRMLYKHPSASCYVLIELL